MAETIAFIGFGEAGQTIGGGLRGEKAVAAIRAYDILFDAAADAGRLCQRAAALGVGCTTGHAEAVRGADMVFLAVTAGSSLDAARSCLPGLGRGQFFLDINSVSPERKRETARLIESTGALYVDVAVMAPVAPYAHRVPILAGGPGAASWLARAQTLGMQVEFVSAEIGQASAIKMFRSIMVKGLEALMLECMVAASDYGVEDKVLATLAETWPGMDWQRLSGSLIERIVTHGRRRAEEMREVANTVRAGGIAPLMAAASAERQQWLADLGVKESLGGRRTESRAELVAAIRSALGKPAR